MDTYEAPTSQALTLPKPTPPEQTAYAGWIPLGDGRARPDAFNSLSGRLRDVFFHGDSVRLAVDIGAERLLIVHRQLETGLQQMALPPVGGTVSLGFDPASLILFADSDGGGGGAAADPPA